MSDDWNALFVVPLFDWVERGSRVKICRQLILPTQWLAMVSFNWRCCIVLTLLVCVRSDQEREMSCENDFFSSLSMNLRSDGNSPEREDKLIQCAKAPPGSPICFDTMPPKEFVVQFHLANGQKICDSCVPGVGPGLCTTFLANLQFEVVGKHHDLQECVCEFKFSLCQSVWFEWDA